MMNSTNSASAGNHEEHRFDMRLIRRVIETDIECRMHREDFPGHLQLDAYESWTERIVTAIEREIAASPAPSAALHPDNVERVIREEIDELMEENRPEYVIQHRISSVPLFGSLMCAFHHVSPRDESLRDVALDNDCNSRRSNV